jgi:asparagine synthase (glutamine-hydrolysing)
MCGINGFNFTDENLIRSMNDKIRHRGPDDTGFFISRKWSLGHNRLSIIDLSPLGHQPMFNSDKTLAIVFNGEIYNYLEIKEELLKKGYSFVSKTDTEVLLYAFREWGTDCLRRLNGIFSFAILNTVSGEMVLARDHIGVKPLYYYYKDKKFIFSSEAKAILTHQIDCSLNVDALNIYFRLLYIPSPLTIWHNIYKFEPGHFAVVKDGQLTMEKYWHFGDSPLITDKEYIKEEISRLLKESVKMQLMSDRPLGVFLSGGIDSTVITGIMSEYSSRVNTFSIGYETTEETEKYNNDMHIARRTAKHFGAVHHEYILGADDIKANLEKSIYHMDEPISNHVQTVNFLLARFATDYVKVVLGGDGGDELFGGYERYYYNYLIDLYQKIPSLIRQNIISEKIFELFNKKQVYQKLNSRVGVNRYLEFFAQKEKTILSFLRPEYNKKEFLPDWLANKHFGQIEKDFTRQFMRTDIKTWLPDESLARSDRMSMAHGLEQRVPFLDYRLVELADRIPIGLKIGSKGLNFISSGHRYQGKIILREAMKKYLPDFVLEQNKWGWFSPAAKWLRGPLRPYIKEILSPSYCRETSQILNFDSINKIYSDHLNKKQYGLNTLWSIITFQLWYRQFVKK